ncbi:UNVERIFIED_CONTAM: hypothetical protein FKN15_059743 [Acipenser sinensis]
MRSIRVIRRAAVLSECVLNKKDQKYPSDPQGCSVIRVCVEQKYGIVSFAVPPMRDDKYPGDNALGIAAHLNFSDPDSSSARVPADTWGNPINAMHNCAMAPGA